MDVALSLAITEVLYRKGTVHDLVVTLDIHKGVITVPQFKAVLPGDMVLQANATAPVAPATAPAKPAAAAAPAGGAVQASGEISVAGPKLRDTLAWLGIDVSGVPADKLQKLDLNGKLASSANGLQISDLAIDLDGQQAKGSGAVTFAVPLVAVTTLQLDRFDLDAYMPPAQPAVPVAPTVDAATAVTTAPPATKPATARSAGAAAARQDAARLRAQGQGGQARVPQGDVEWRRGRHLGAGQPLEAEHREGGRPPGRQDGRSGVGDRFRHRAALRHHLQRHDARRRQAHRLRWPAEICERQDRRGIGRRRRGRHAGRRSRCATPKRPCWAPPCGPPARWCSARISASTSRASPCRPRTRAGCSPWRPAARAPAPAPSMPPAPSRVTGSARASTAI